MDKTDLIEKLKKQGIYNILEDMKCILLHQTDLELDIYSVDDILGEVVKCFGDIYWRRRLSSVWPVSLAFAYFLHSIGMLTIKNTNAGIIIKNCLDRRFSSNDVQIIDSYIYRGRIIISNHTESEDISDSFEGSMNNVLKYVARMHEARLDEKKRYMEIISEKDETISMLRLDLTNARNECKSIVKEKEALAIKVDDLCKERNKSKDITSAFCRIAERYMNANRKKSQSYREKVKASLVDIMSQLKLVLPEGIHRAINNFDDADEPKVVNFTINGNVGVAAGNVNKLKTDK